MSDVSRPQQQAATPTASVRRHGDYTHLVSGLWGSAPGIRLQQGEPTVQRTGNHLSGCSSEGTPDSEARAATAQRNRRRWQDPECKAKSLEWQRRRRARTGSTQDPRRARNRLQAIVDDWKGRGCVDCGYADIRAIDPDHIDGATKDGHVSRLVQLCASAARIVAELEKCVPRCARCHRRVTQVQRPCSWRSAERVPASWLRRLEFQDRNDAIKVLRGCADCGWRGWARGLDWDHGQVPGSGVALRSPA